VILYQNATKLMVFCEKNGSALQIFSFCDEKRRLEARDWKLRVYPEFPTG
jgi:hypothetical protein